MATTERPPKSWLIKCYSLTVAKADLNRAQAITGNHGNKTTAAGIVGAVIITAATGTRFRRITAAGLVAGATPTTAAMTPSRSKVTQ